MSTVTHLLFDLGGTLFQPLESTTSDRNLVAALQPLNRRLVSARLPQLDAQAFVQSYRQRRAALEQSWADTAFFLHRQLVNESFKQALGTVLSATATQLLTSDESQPIAKAAEMFCDRQRQSVVADLQPQADMHDALQRLQRSGVTMGIVSNIDEDYLQPLVARHGLSRYLRFWLSSEQARSCKPDARIFAQALNRLQVPASPSALRSVVFVGDSTAHDVVGANRFGMRSALLCPDGASGSAPELEPDVHAEQRPTYRLSCLRELVALVSG